MQIEMERTTTAAPADVWAVMTDIEGSADRISGITEVERLDDGDGFGVGTRWRETRVLFGKEASEEMEVTAVDEGHRYTVEAHNRGTHYVSDMIVEPAGTGSVLRMTFGAKQASKFSKLMARTVGKAFEGATRKALKQDLDDIAAAAEARSA